ncbi:related to polyphosphate kinase [Desulfotalea psychrophila LSv54]|uniref:Polyphosphate kinase n=2 Tax=Desulfotalea psychrophila TaxID=84980 RepID=Q6ANU2_DESPS|nr:related to polyphosphate kinase [Desulfotalea psychrophila LSv54]
MWLKFNGRVLAEAMDSRNPLLARVFFFAVVDSNLDEFFMKRIGRLKQQVSAGVKTLSVDALLPQEQIDVCTPLIQDIIKRQYTLGRELQAGLASEGIVVASYAGLPREQRAWLDNFFIDQVFPLLTPQGVDPAHPFPFISNLSINLLISVRYPGSEHVYRNRVKMPVNEVIPRFVRVGSDDVYIPLEDLVSNNLQMLLPGMEIDSVDVFRVTRNAMTGPSGGQVNDLLHMIESALRERKFAEIVRLEVGRGISSLNRGMLAAELGIDEEKDVVELDDLLGKGSLMEIAKIDRDQLHFSPHHLVNNPDLIEDDPNIFHVLREKKAVLLQHPYESFETSVERFLDEASQDPKVLAIKMTLYRTANDSRIIEYLIEASQNGKQVAVVMELKARFDESANIRWAGYLEQAGIHVTYGVLGLKTHSKVIFVVRKDYDGIRRYAHIGTGNYHSGTARGYCDLGLLTCDPDIVSDLTEFFNYLTTGYTPIRRYKKLLPSPRILKKALLSKINREIAVQEKGGVGLIQLKTNALEDRDLTEALYRASQAGVHVDLIVRDSCRLRPGIEGLSENVRVISIVGRFLEHSRLFYFRNNGAEEYYIGSADLMTRNLERRVEACVPVELPHLQAQLREILDLQLANSRNVWEMDSGGNYLQRTTKGKKKSETLSVHQLLIDSAEKRDAAGKLKLAKKRSQKQIKIRSRSSPSSER